MMSTLPWSASLRVGILATSVLAGLPAVAHASDPAWALAALTTNADRLVVDASTSPPIGHDRCKELANHQTPFTAFADRRYFDGRSLQVTTASTRAQQTPIPVDLETQAKRYALKTPLTLFAIAAASDWISTGFALTHAMHEDNPTINWAKTPVGTIAAGAGLDAVGAWAWTKLLGKNHPKLAAVGLSLASVFRGYLVIHNIRGFPKSVQK